MKKLKIALSGAVATLFLIVSTACAGPDRTAQSAMPAAEQTSSLSSQAEEVPKEEFTLDEAYINQCNFAYPDRILGRNQIVHSSSLAASEGDPPVPLPYSLQILDTNVSKKLPAEYSLAEAKDNLSAADQMDENGDMIGDSSYLQVKVRVTNESDQPNVVYLNSSQVLTLPGTQEMMAHDLELRLLNNPQYSWESKSHVRYEFEPNEQAEFSYGYIVQDKYLDDPFLGMSVGGTGSNWDNGTQQFILLNGN